MTEPILVERCKSFINCQLADAKGAAKAVRCDRPVVTLSRQAGAGGITIGEKLARYLRAHDPETPCGWMVFNKNLVQQVLQDHHLPAHLAKYMPEDKVSGIDDTMAEILGLHPAAETLVHYTEDTILRLAHQGNVILVSRGAEVLTTGWQNALHVRIIGSLEQRVAHIQEYLHFSRGEAEAFVRHKDNQRERYLKKYFGRSTDDPLLYSLIFNTDWVSYDEAARIIGDIALGRRTRG